MRYTIIYLQQPHQYRRKPKFYKACPDSDQIAFSRKTLHAALGNLLAIVGIVTIREFANTHSRYLAQELMPLHAPDSYSQNGLRMHNQTKFS